MLQHEKFSWVGGAADWQDDSISWETSESEEVPSDGGVIEFAGQFIMNTSN